MTVFVDTNILVYTYDPRNRDKSTKAEMLLAQLWDSDSGALSTQVLQEFYNVATGKLRLAPARARRIVANYAEWATVETTPQLIVSASLLHELHGINFRDALIVEAALLAGADTLLTEDLQDGLRFGELTVRNPFSG
ncbi:PIN domain-containing protein [Pseudonocardia eucalypti]|uniref:Ribonuclease VapC n=1 Tax=Pseudonocardia eucalypti TaxID=648755 RepID=A0ABP9PQD0_9PSEU|nr:putative nucleic acid-binding protein [Pseudonocardia eucalypti]